MNMKSRPRALCGCSPRVKTVRHSGLSTPPEEWQTDRGQVSGTRSTPTARAWPDPPQIAHEAWNLRIVYFLFSITAPVSYPVVSVLLQPGCLEVELVWNTTRCASVTQGLEGCTRGGERQRFKAASSSGVTVFGGKGVNHIARHMAPVNSLEHGNTARLNLGCVLL